MKLAEQTPLRYADHLNARMTQLLRDYANRFEVMTDEDKEIQIVLFRSFTEVEQETVPQRSVGSF